jgi:hypothetical protein
MRIAPLPSDMSKTTENTRLPVKGIDPIDPTKPYVVPDLHRSPCGGGCFACGFERCQCPTWKLTVVPLQGDTDA